jgi:hypothetical protein
MPNFNEVRRYVRYDIRPDHSLVKIGRLASLHKPNGDRVMCHYLGVELRGADIIGQVCLLQMFRYFVTLSRDPFAFQVQINACRVFDLDEQRTYSGSLPPP